MQIPRQLPILVELPQEDLKYPSFVLGNRPGNRVLMRIGMTSPIWSFEAQSKPLRLSRHGTFSVEGCWTGGAVIRMGIPRKGWNPSGKAEARIELSPRTEITIRRGELFRRELDADQWEHIVASYNFQSQSAHGKRHLIEVLA